MSSDIKSNFPTLVLTKSGYKGQVYPSQPTAPLVHIIHLQCHYSRHKYICKGYSVILSPTFNVGEGLSIMTPLYESGNVLPLKPI